jgi:uncharacterized protein (TIGR04222 family)
VYEAVRRSTPLTQLEADPLVASGVTEVQASVVRAGWLVESGARGLARLGGFVLAVLFGVGLLRTIFGIQNGRPVFYLVLLLIVTALLSVYFLAATPRLTRAGAAAMKEIQSRNRHLDPRQAPSWTTYGASGMAMGVALWGTAALWSADPAFAADAGLRHQALGGSGAASSLGGDGGSGASCSGGGGGGCGGGGCGGGCGGG